MMPDHSRMWIASADANSPAIAIFDLNVNTGAMHPADETPDAGSCLALVRHPALPVVYAAGAFDGVHAIRAFRIAPDERLTRIGQQPAGGYEPCSVAVTADGRYALIVNYTGPERAGSIRIFPVQADGDLLPHSDHIQLEGDGPHRARQDASHPHMIRLTPDDQCVLVPDLGTDRVMIYRLDRQRGQLTPHTQPDFRVAAGSGPRHLAFHPALPVLYVLSELEPLLTVVTYADGRFEAVATVRSLPPDVPTPPDHHGADIHVAPSGRFLYVSNRGHNSIGIYAIAADGLTLTGMGAQSTLGAWPRGFALHPSGQMLIVANQHTHDLHTFHVDVASGHLTATGHRATVPAPVGIAWATDAG